MPPLFTFSESTGLLHVESWRDKTWLIHGFTTRSAGDFARLETALEAMPSWGAGGMTLESVRQIHSSTVHLRAADTASSTRPRADALLTRDAGRLLTIRIADCVPLLFIDERRRAVGAVHAGWRGTAKRIAQRAAARMRDTFGSQPEDLEETFTSKLTPPEMRASTTIAIVATDADLTQVQAQRVAIAAQDGLARAILPSHTPFDGDLVFVASSNKIPAASG